MHTVQNLDCGRMSYQAMHSTPIKKHNPGALENSRFPSSPSSGIMSVGDLDSSTLEKQRKELQLLITELKDRDRELNDMVAAHQQQMVAWERDRQRALLLEKKSDKFEGELKKRAEQIRLLIQRLKSSESKQKSKDSALESSQVRMKQLEKDMSSTTYEVQDLKEKNTSLNSSLTDMSSKINKMEEREQELSNDLRLKENEFRNVSDHVVALSSKVRILNADLQDTRRSESKYREEIQDERSRYKQLRSETDSLKAEMLEKTDEILSYRREISKLKDEVHGLRKEVYLRDDEIRRKDELIDLQKSKQERTDKELSALRMLYERQQQELTMLHISFSDSQDILEKQMNNTSSSQGFDLDNFEDSGSETTNDLLEEARRSTNSAALLQPEIERAGRPSSPIHLSHSSPTSKLQRLLAESREMVHNLERATSTSIPRPSSARAGAAHTSC